MNVETIRLFLLGDQTSQIEDLGEQVLPPEDSMEDPVQEEPPVVLYKDPNSPGEPALKTAYRMMDRRSFLTYGTGIILRKAGLAGVGIGVGKAITESMNESKGVSIEQGLVDSAIILGGTATMLQGDRMVQSELQRTKLPQKT